MKQYKGKYGCGYFPAPGGGCWGIFQNADRSEDGTVAESKVEAWFATAQEAEQQVEKSNKAAMENKGLGFNFG